MKSRSILVLTALAFSLSGFSNAFAERVVVATSMGEITIELDAERAPISVANFLEYVDDKAYDGTIFHRVIPGFMIQGGGFLPSMEEVPEKAEIRNEADNGLKNVMGTVAMARTNIIDSAGRQFYINVSDNDFLDHSEASCTREQEKSMLAAREKGLNKPATCGSFGYAVFGHVVDGMDVVHSIEIVKTHMSMGHRDVPQEPIVINSIRRLETNDPG